jgi:hypothetical protein
VNFALSLSKKNCLRCFFNTDNSDVILICITVYTDVIQICISDNTDVILIGDTDMEAECSDDVMKLRVKFNATFSGLIYSAGKTHCHTNTCVGRWPKPPFF